MIKFSRIIKENSDMKDKYKDIISDIKKYITDTINDEDESKVKSFIVDYIDKPDKVIIEGLVNDSDVYDFYMKYISDIDDILAINKHFEKSPQELNSYSIYDYAVISTREAILLFLKMM